MRRGVVDFVPAAITAAGWPTSLPARIPEKIHYPFHATQLQASIDLLWGVAEEGGGGGVVVHGPSCSSPNPGLSRFPRLSPVKNYRLDVRLDSAEVLRGGGEGGGEMIAAFV